MCCNDNDISSTIANRIEVIKNVAYNLNKLFMPLEESDTTLQPKKKKRKSQEPGETRTDVQSKFTALHCACGVQFASEDELNFHMKKNPINLLETGTVCFLIVKSI